MGKQNEPGRGRRSSLPGLVGMQVMWKKKKTGREGDKKMDGPRTAIFLGRVIRCEEFPIIEACGRPWLQSGRFHELGHQGNHGRAQ